MACLFLLVCASKLLAQADVDVALDVFGAGGAYRPGDFTGIRLTLTSNLREPHAVHVVWEVPEGLGDISEQTRAPVALSPGQPVQVWMYAKLLPTVDARTLWTVRVYGDDDGRRGEELGGAIVGPSTAQTRGLPPIPIEEGIIGVVGRAGGRAAALNDYNIRLDRAAGVPQTGHERTNIIDGLSPQDLPDRWEGLDLFEAVVWTNATPGDLPDAQARALREWIERGGHLVIILQSAGNDWGLGALAVTPLHDLLPQTQPRTDEVALSDLLPVISKRNEIGAVDDIPVAIRVFETVDNYYEPFIALPWPDRRVVALQRLHGFGRITVLGIDINNGQLLARPRNGRGGEFVEADVIWNRILGRRVDSLQLGQLNTLQENDQLNRSYRRALSTGRGQLILDEINLQGEALKGIGLAFFLFVVYWLLAGPLGFTLLKSTHRVRHAWLAFALTSVVFTVLAWIGVWVFRQKDVQVQHLTFLDFVQLPSDDPRAGQQAHRATSWFTVFLPGYGNRALELANQGGGRNLLTAFSPPGVEETRFRNVSRYTVSMNDPSRYTVPARSTTKQMYARWWGTLESEEDWNRIFQVIEPITMTRQGTTTLITGQIGHSLPAPLSNVRIILIEPRYTTRREYRDDVGVDPVFLTGGALVRVSKSVAPRQTQMPPDTPFDISGIGTATAGSFTMELNDWLADIGGLADDGSGMQPGLGDGMRSSLFKILSFYHQMPPPQYTRTSQMSDTQPALVRSLGRELDLSPWLTRPCIILYGEIADSEMPVPFEVDGERPESNGRTIVRWIYPLPLDIEDLAPETNSQE
jgi:hypothetical protein